VVLFENRQRRMTSEEYDLRGNQLTQVHPDKQLLNRAIKLIHGC